ncbi:XRE family transcriptional regulator [Ruminococcaceae bacterium AM07-15]|nr:XRE family transcriptional regulator [Ruminococcaceae bacterium AM07-15]
MNSINSRIAQCLEASGLTNTAFAKKLNVSQSFISRLASGTTNPSDRTIMDICREFHVDEHWLRTGEGEMFRPRSRSEELAAFFGDLLADTPDFRHSLITVLSRMSPEEWAILEKKAWELVDEMKKTDPQ